MAGREDGGAQMNCGYCGKPVADELRFCPACGAPVGQTPQDQQTAARASVQQVPPTTQQRVQYIPPEENASPPPAGPNRTLLWIGIAAAALLIIALAVLIPLLLTRGNGETGLTSTTGPTSTLAPVTTTAVAPTTTVPVAGPVGDSSGSWIEVSVPGGPWSAQEVAVSDDALLVVTPVASGYKLSAVMLDSGDVVTVSQSEALFGVDLDGLLAVWWEATGWNSATETYTKQYIKSRLLPGGAKKTIATGGATPRMGLPQVAAPWVTWVLSEPWADNPDEYWTERIMAVKVGDSGAPSGSAVTLVPSALAFALGDSGWRYSLSSTQVAWENGADIAGYGPGVHVMLTDGSDHQSLGAEAWRPSLWGDLLAFQDGSLQLHDLGTGVTRMIDPSGDFAAVGPTFAAYYKPSSSGSYLVARGYGGAHEQTLDELSQPPYFCPVISVSDHYIAYAFDEQIHLFKWQAE
jgi:hypothetical protein